MNWTAKISAQKKLSRICGTRRTRIRAKKLQSENRKISERAEKYGTKNIRSVTTVNAAELTSAKFSENSRHFGGRDRKNNRSSATQKIRVRTKSFSSGAIIFVLV